MKSETYNDKARAIKEQREKLKECPRNAKKIEALKAEEKRLKARAKEKKAEEKNKISEENTNNKSSTQTSDKGKKLTSKPKKISTKLNKTYNPYKWCPKCHEYAVIVDEDYWGEGIRYYCCAGSHYFMEGDSFPPGPKLKRVITNCKYCNNGVCKNDENSNNYDDICPGDCSYYYRK